MADAARASSPTDVTVPSEGAGDVVAAGEATEVPMGPRPQPIGPEAPPEPGDPRRYFDRQASELEYHARVLAMAARDDLALLERVKFLAIFAGNIDEFFRVRVAGLKEQVAAGVGSNSRAGNTPAEQLATLHTRQAQLAAEHTRIWRREVRPALEAQGIVLVDVDQLDDAEQAHLADVFERRVFPVLTPLAVDPAHPFPFISDLSLNLAVTLHDPETERRSFARVKVPSNLDRLYRLPGGGEVQRFVRIEQVIAAHLDRLFSGLEVVDVHQFRVTRNADYEVEADEASDLLDAIESELLRRRFGRAVRLEVRPEVSATVRELLVDELELGPGDVYEIDAMLDLTCLWQLLGLDRPDLKEPPWEPVEVPALTTHGEEPVDVFAVLRERDVLVQHPYESFDMSVLRLIEHAAADPRVQAIKQTIYRTSGDSPIVRALVRAAESGKQAVALVELKARFDEAANIQWARRLEEAGVHVVYGFVEMKTHTKIALVVRHDEDDTLRLYGHVGTGNYNPKTARLYEDLGLLTADPDVTADLAELFNFLTGHSRQRDYRSLVVSPVTLQPRLLELIGHEARPGGRIVIKVNNLADVAVIDALYAASQAGAEIDLIVRSICCLRPGVEGLSGSIRVRSIVGRFLEHSRIFRFGSTPGEGQYLIGSADLLPRNLYRRIEAVTAVDDPALQERLDEILDSCLADDRLAWTLGPDGTWSRVPTERGVDAQERLAQLAIARATAGRND